ncbi:2-amino-4-hydroxy-6-hydroxymethyldihydropteridine diphosphokinase [Tropicibacter alexandrii]|uniref:2-amino-4-hydroxy-6- hydroxymethyldihydropteridine diphosphokinase n=1 Tax=Tropicibacter alexandrii TaxID=2267683 RepID=UPI000EF48539|nr:2-amino-4-hydroxy-6-hydroxymethyldihydropteridine diphosphokinase [Tropicibacter alexandrii]
MVQEFLIALGSNLGSDHGDPSDTLTAALHQLASVDVTLRRVSRYFATPCFPAGAGPDYVNAAAALSYDGCAASLLGKLHEVEYFFGRQRIQRWGSRSLDLDVIAAGEDVTPDRVTYEAWRTLAPELQTRESPGELILPHPRLQDRAFVLVPLNDIAPGWIHPILRQSVADMLAALPPELRDEPVPLTGMRL